LVQVRVVIFMFNNFFLLCYCSFLLYIFTISFFFRYEWQHRGSTHIHGFLWLQGAPNMEILDWSNPSDVHCAKTYFDRYVTTWNPRDIHRRNIMVPRSINDDPVPIEYNSDIFFQSS
jgi:hypothetical protein